MRVLLRGSIVCNLCSTVFYMNIYLLFQKVKLYIERPLTVLLFGIVGKQKLRCDVLDVVTLV